METTSRRTCCWAGTFVLSLHLDASYFLPSTAPLQVFVNRPLILCPSRNAILGERFSTMASALDDMVKPTTPRPPSRPTHTERRSSRRCKITQLMRIRPSDPERDPFEDIRPTESVSRTGAYFHSSETGYEVGMRLFVSMPYS